MATMNPYAPERRHNPMERRTPVASASLGDTDRYGNRIASAERTSASRDNAIGMSAFDWIAMTLLFIGGLNWGLVGLFDLDVVAMLFGDGTAVARLIYVLVGLSAVYSVYTASKMSRSEY